MLTLPGLNTIGKGGDQDDMYEFLRGRSFLKTITNQGLVYNKEEPIAYVFEAEFPFFPDSTEGVYL